MSRDLAELPTCTRCALSQSRQRVVVGSGPLNPALMVIGEAPGRDEDEGGEPFIGRSGRLLFQLIQEEVGLSRAQCFVTNVVKCRPPANRTPTRDELIACRPWLSEQFQLVRAPLVLALGNTAARSVFRFEQGIGVTHGQIVKLGRRARNGDVSPGRRAARRRERGRRHARRPTDPQDPRGGAVSWRRRCASAEDTIAAGEAFAGVLSPR